MLATVRVDFNDGVAAESVRVERIERERLLAALDGVEQAVEDSVRRDEELLVRMRWMRAQLEAGVDVAELVATEEQPRSVELLTANMVALETLGAEYRGRLASAMREEGLTIQSIADLYGVTRQRISALLKQRS